jgi:Uma2 family endonuclease
MRVIHKLGPSDHGRTLELDEFMAADYQGGYQYELIDGKLYVSPSPNPPQNTIEAWLTFKVALYAHEHPDILNHVASKARVVVPGRPGATIPEPDMTAYVDYPWGTPLKEIHWEDLRPILVGEVLSPGDPDKDLVRNRELYLQVPSIKEYWIVDTRESADQPLLIALRRHGGKWREVQVPYPDTYTTKLLPRFKLKVDPRS